MCRYCVSRSGAVQPLQRLPVEVLRHERRLVPGRLRPLVGHLQEEQERQLLDVVPVREPVVPQQVAVVPQLLDDLLAMCAGHRSSVSLCARLASCLIAGSSGFSTDLYFCRDDATWRGSAPVRRKSRSSRTYSAHRYQLSLRRRTKSSVDMGTSEHRPTIAIFTLPRLSFRSGTGSLS